MNCLLFSVVILLSDNSGIFSLIISSKSPAVITRFSYSCQALSSYIRGSRLKKTLYRLSLSSRVLEDMILIIIIRSKINPIYSRVFSNICLVFRQYLKIRFVILIIP
jgi:hypothetical protein